MVRDMTADDVRRLIARDAESRELSFAAWAKKSGLSQAYVAHVLQGRQEPGKKMLAVLGLRKRVVYERVRA